MTQTAQSTPNVPPKRSYSLADIVFAWFSVIAGYLLCRSVPVSEKPLGALCLIVAVFVFTAIFLKRNGHAFGPRPIAALVTAVAAGASLIVSDSPTLQGFATFYALGAYGYMIYAATGNTLGSAGLLLADWGKALFVLPFYSFTEGELFRGLFHGRIRKGAGVALKLLIGCAIAVIPTAIVFSLLSYDEDFSRLFSRIFSWETPDPASHLVSLIFTIPLAMYLYGLYVSCVDRKRPDLLNDAQRERMAAKAAVAPLVTVLAAVVPLLFLYCLFFISQWQYYLSGFTGVLPPFFSYAEYAREGFFQLCTVSVINLIVLTAVILFSRKTRANGIAVKVLTVIFAVFTLILISTALAKMLMYIRYYGLTVKRVYATWLMLVLAVVFLLVALSRFVKSVKAPALCATVLVVAFTVLSLCNVEAVIARYNVDRYIDGSTTLIDLSAMRDLGDAAVPDLVLLGRHLERQSDRPLGEISYTEATENSGLYYQVARELLDARSRLQATDRGIVSFTVNRARAEAALDEVYP